MMKSLANKLHLQRRASALLFYSKFLLKINNFEFIEGLRIATNQVHSVLPNESKNGFQHCIVHSREAWECFLVTLTLKHN